MNPNGPTGPYRPGDNFFIPESAGLSEEELGVQFQEMAAERRRKEMVDLVYSMLETYLIEAFDQGYGVRTQIEAMIPHGFDETPQTNEKGELVAWKKVVFSNFRRISPDPRGANGSSSPNTIIFEALTDPDNPSKRDGTYIYDDFNINRADKQRHLRFIVSTYPREVIVEAVRRVYARWQESQAQD